MHPTPKKKKMSDAEAETLLAKVEALYVTQKLALYRPSDKKFLLVLNSENRNWELPGGVKEKHEDFLSALNREVIEEIGTCEYTEPQLIATLRDEYHFHGNDYPMIVLGYTARCIDTTVTLGDEHEQFSWKTLEEISRMTEKEIHAGMQGIIAKAALYEQQAGYLHDVQRLTADFENYKKRKLAESKEFSAHLAKAIVSDLIPVLSNLQAAADHVPADLRESPWVMGITYIEKQFEDALKNYGVTPIEVKPGDPFNPTEHEAIDQQTKDGEESEHKIEKVVQKGYKMGERVIKAARVIVS